MFETEVLISINVLLHLRVWSVNTEVFVAKSCLFVSFTEVMVSVKLIPKPKEPLLPPKPGQGECVCCAVVGTAGILKGSKMGKEIDAHDHVFR